ncbi:monovalent cation/H+ antiporter subunit D [Falsirhodobacter algicola]|uniref:Monovalent cation/H+ antiporter subunit D n=1 Tax=Falsirhodobacter algicola TaxID=2692330 RepID=A0A8J8SKB3_9RHOB|nr:monovalent cation/H+ antiporter subunit D [Falsirhodobacter algicola]QUS35336.1 monovalent cation/H+ antiporter subunit D [Falsirhodobacter algicola]
MNPVEALAGATTPHHLILAPILVPLIAAAAMLFYEDRQRGAKLAISLVAAVTVLIASVVLMLDAKGEGPSGGTEVGLYLLGDWPTPFGINLVLDRLSALMLFLSALLSVPALVYASAMWQGRGQHFHSLFMFLMMGVNGAVLTGDLFNLFVFFEIMLAASYGLALHGSGPERVRAGMHYIAINLLASLFFLIGVAMIYGVAGTLNMAELARQLPALDEAQTPLVHAALAILAVVFLVKAGMWPMCFWLPSTYQAAAAPASAMFAILTKVGVYVLLRLTFLAFAPGEGVSITFAAQVLVAGGIATMLFGSAGILGAQNMSRMAGHAVLISSGTMLTVIGLGLQGGGSAMLSGALFYMVGSTLALSALFLLVELAERGRGAIASMLALSADLYGAPDEEMETPPPVPGLLVPAGMTLLALCYALLVLVLAGLPPLPGFLGKVMMLSGLLEDATTGRPQVWVFMAVLIGSGFATLVALMRVGVQTFWTSVDEQPPAVMVTEIAPVIVLIAVIVGMTWQARPIMRYLEATATALHRPSVYVNGVLEADRTVDRRQEAGE